jgi:hypothetical protein
MMSGGKHRSLGKNVFLISIILLWSSFAFAQSPQSEPGQVSKAEPAKKTAASSSSAFHEDWNSIGLDTSNFKLEPPLLGEIDDVPGQSFIRERWHLTWRPGDTEDVYVVRPRGIANPPVVLYLYSFPQDTERFRDDTWCTTATSSGYAAVGFVSALTGYRAEHRPAKEWFVSELQESLATSVHDVQMILNYLDTRGDLDMHRVGMFGQGSGGAIAILASAADARIKALDVLTPWGDWPAWLAKSNVVTDTDRAKFAAPQFLASVASLDPMEWLPKVKARSVRIQNVRQDAAVPANCQEHIESVAPGFAEINQYADVRALYPYAAGNRLFEWLRLQLQPDAKPQELAEKSQRIHFFPSTVQPIR